MAITQKWIFQKLLLQILNKWIWIALTVLTAITFTFLFNRYTNKVYRTSIQVVKGSSEYNMQQSAYLFDANSQSSRINEKYERAFITSLPILLSVVQDLDLDVSYFSRGRVKTAERFGFVPLRVDYDTSSMEVPYYIPFTIEYVNEQSYQISSEHEEWHGIARENRFSFGQPVSIGGFNFTIHRLGSLDAGDWIFMIRPEKDVAKEIQRSISVTEVRQGYTYSRSNTSMLELSIQSSLPHKDRAILDQLFVALKDADVVRKTEQSERTIDFIEEQLGQITDSMKIIAAQMRTLKLSNKELSAGSSAVFGKITTLEEEKTQLLLVNRYCDYLEDYITNSAGEEIIAPSTFGINNDILGGLVSQYITLQLEKREVEELDLNSSVYRRQIRQMERQTEEIEELILMSITNTRQANQIRIDEYNEQIEILFNSARSVLNEEIVYTDFERLYGLNEKVFTLLMDKKAEAGITQASVISDYRILEPSFTSGIPLKPQARRNYMTAIILALLIPISFLFVQSINRNSILSLTELEEIVTLPVAGVIGFAKNPRAMIDAPQSLISENFRSLRSNLRFVNGESNNKTFVVTSSVSEEGKTFISANLAASMALQGKRTIVLGADMRKPTLHNYFDSFSEQGLSQYLSDQVSLEEVIRPGGIPNLDVIYSGTIPPNPSELMSGKRMENLLGLLGKMYEIVLLDTPPIGLISDASEVFDWTDTILLVARQQKTPVSTLQHADHFMDEKSLQKSMLVFNGVRKGVGYGYYGYGYGYGYGRGYGYGYYKEEK